MAIDDCAKTGSTTVNFHHVTTGVFQSEKSSFETRCVKARGLGDKITGVNKGEVVFSIERVLYATEM